MIIDTGTATDAPVLSIADLTVEFTSKRGDKRVLHGVSLDVHRGETVAVVGESGSGKSVTALAAMGLLPANARTSGRIAIHGVDVLGVSLKKRRRLRNARAAIIFQDPVNALNPVYTIGFQLIESIRAHRQGISRVQARVKAIELLGKVGIPDPEHRLRYFPHQFSGGQCQRIMIAMALATEPELLIADEPTTALDVTVQAEILELLRRLQRETRTAILFITHDMGVVADLADRVVVMKDGAVVDSGDVRQIFYAPKAAYTRALLAAVPRLDTASAVAADAPGDRNPVVAFDNVTVDFGGRLGAPTFRALDAVSFTVYENECVGLVGESGSGKSTLGRCAVGAVKLSGGDVVTCGTSLASIGGRQLEDVRKKTGIVFQNPANTLDPRYTIAQSIGESLSVHAGLHGTRLKQRVAELLSLVELPTGWSGRYPHELSGGQRQRVAIARAIALNPQVLIADEPTSALDVSVQAKILELFENLQKQLRFSCIFISHDLAVVNQLCHRVAVLKRGTLVEVGPAAQLLRNPHEEYTKRLIASSLVADPDKQRQRIATPVP